MSQAGSPSPDYRVTYDGGLVEEAVLLAERALSPADAEAFRAERDRAYDVRDPDEREARFEALHGRWFTRLGLDRPLHEALGDQGELLRRTRGCRVLRAISRGDEMADVRSEVGAAGEAPTIMLYLRPQSFLEADSLRALLDRELLHVADMLDPTFGYAKELPVRSEDPAYANLLRERYRVVWDTTIDGRLSRSGRVGARVRAARGAEFARTFPMIGDGTDAAFEAWFERPRPSHAAIVAFIESPRSL